MQAARPSDSFHAIAIISAYNEGDIISPAIAHFIENGVVPG